MQSEFRTFGIAGDCKTTVLGAGVWVETATEVGGRFMASWREKNEDAATRHRQEKREPNESRESVTAQGSVEPPKRHQLINLVDKPTGSCTDTRRAEICVAPRRVDASRSTPLTTCSFVLSVVRALCFMFFSLVPAASLL